MTKTSSTRRMSRRDTLKAALVPATAVLTADWLVGCSSDAMQTAVEPTQASGSPAPAPGSSAGTTGAATPPSSTAGGPSQAGRVAAQTSPIAGSPSPASAFAGSSAGGTTGTAAGASGAAPAAAGGGGMAAQSPAAGASGSVAGAGGSAGGMSVVAAPDVMWASGGTKSMKGPYPDPFTAGMGGPSCKVYPAQTLGPCYRNGPAMREDISDGAKGLPTRLSFLVVKADGCTPISGATVDIWHSGFDGVYSAYGSGVCNPDSLDVASQMFCRGVQTTNAQGRADFSTIFPGWYSSRSVHIHFTIRVNGTEEATSQLYFEDALTTEIQAQGEYKPRGMRRTTNANDSIFRSGGASPQDVIMLTAKRPDGSLHAWKVIAVG